MAPKVGKVLNPVGFKVVRVNVENGTIEDFAANKGDENGPASRLKKGGIERPVAVRFSKDGRALYIADFGIMQMSHQGRHPKKHRRHLEDHQKGRPMKKHFLTICLLSLALLFQSCGTARRSEPFRGPMSLTDSEVARGLLVFKEHCHRCHPGGEAGLGPSLNDKPLPGFLMRIQIRKGLGAMPGFKKDKISADDLDRLIAYMKAVRRHKGGPKDATR